MRTIISALLLAFTLNTAFAQDEDVKYIKNQYYDIVNQITESRKQGYEGSLYCNTMELNKFGKAWRAVGLFNEKVEIWYDDDPRHEEDGKPGNTLKMIVVTGESSVYTYYKEFLFDKGELIFSFSKFSAENDSDELRLYFKGSKLIKRVATQEGPMAEESNEILQEANNWMAIYLKSFGL